MTALALRTSDFANGVSRLHGDVTRQMWEPLLQEREQNGQRPLTHITNGVHVPTWLSLEMAQLFEHHLGADWRDRQDDAGVLEPRARDSRRGAVERAHGAEAVPVHVHPPARARSVGAGERQRGGGRRGRAAARSRSADDRLRAPVHGLQAAGADLQGSRPAHPPAVVAAPARADRVRRQGASGRRRRQASSAADLSPRDRSRSTADASRSSTTTICTSRISSRRAATCGSTRRASRSKPAARAA